ncbi:MAG: hypothetical protein AAFU64_06000 [Bacteroidota bacterium]
MKFYAGEDSRIRGAQFIPENQVRQLDDQQTILETKITGYSGKSNQAVFQKEVKAALEAMNIPLTSRQESDDKSCTFLIHLEVVKS